MGSYLPSATPFSEHHSVLIALPSRGALVSWVLVIMNEAAWNILVKSL